MYIVSFTNHLPITHHILVHSLIGLKPPEMCSVQLHVNERRDLQIIYQGIIIYEIHSMTRKPVF